MQLIFLTGHRKAGTTLLHKLFDSHPGLCVYPVDVSLLYAYFPAFTADQSLSDDDLLRRACHVVSVSMEKAGLAETLDLPAFLALLRQRLAAADLRDRAAVLRALLEAWREFSRADPRAPCLVKETSQSIHFDEFAAAFPGLRFVHLLRDPRDNYAALKAGVAKYYSGLGENDLETLASLINRARMDMLAAARNRATAPQSFRALRFEDLVTDQETVMRDLAAFCGIDYLPSLLRPTQFERDFAGNSHEGQRFDGISKGNAGRWRERISPDEAMVIEYWMGAEMRAAGYEPAFDAGESQAAFARFYGWYNTRYFFRDAFAGGDAAP